MLTFASTLNKVLQRNWFSGFEIAPLRPAHLLRILHQSGGSMSRYDYLRMWRNW